MTSARYILLVCVATLFAALGVAQRTSTIHLGYYLESLHTERVVLTDQNRELLCDISVLSHPARISGEIERSNTALVNPVALTQASGKREDAAPSDGAPRAIP
jgi:hypothetical protein